MKHAELPVDQPPAVAVTAFADAWPRAIETEIGAALCAIGAGKDFYISMLNYQPSISLALLGSCGKNQHSDYWNTSSHKSLSRLIS